MTTLKINSELKQVPADIKTLGDLLSYLKIPEGGTGVGLNGKVILASERTSTPIKEGDDVIIISASYGG